MDGDQVAADRSAEKEFAGLIGRLVRNLNVLDRDQTVCCGTTVSQCYTIEALARRGNLSMNQLSQEVGVTTSTMTRVVDVLVRDGAVRRKRNPEDRREVRIELTGKGSELARGLTRCVDEYAKRVLGRIDAAERKRVLSSLRLLADALEEVRPQSGKCSFLGA
jgi:DNA-binding MarR family transcriptional regulator